MPGTKNIDALFAPRNVALVGASDKNWSVRVWENLRRFGYEGGVYPINPNRDQIWGGRCYASLDDLPEPADHLALFLPAEQSLQILEQGGRAGARSATLYAAGFGEGDDTDGRERARRLHAILDRYDIAATGPTAWACLSADHDSARSPMSNWKPPRRAQSPCSRKAACWSRPDRGMSDAGISLSCIVSCGNQTGLTFADYIDRLADDADCA